MPGVQESEHLRSAAFAIYAAVLAKVRRRSLVFPLKHQVLNLLILLVLHLAGRVGTQRLVVLLLLPGFGRTWRLFSQLEKEAGKALWFLKQCVSLFRSPQAPVRQAAVWFAGTAFPRSPCVLILSSA